MIGPARDIPDWKVEAILDWEFTALSIEVAFSHCLVRDPQKTCSGGSTTTNYPNRGYDFKNYFNSHLFIFSSSQFSDISEFR